MGADHLVDERQAEPETSAGAGFGAAGEASGEPVCVTGVEAVSVVEDGDDNLVTCPVDR